MLTLIMAYPLSNKYELFSTKNTRSLFLCYTLNQQIELTHIPEYFLLKN